MTLERDGEGAALTVRDWGPGFDLAALSRTRRTMGLLTMRERAASVRGELAVEPAPGGGTEVRVRVGTRAARARRAVRA